MRRAATARPHQTPVFIGGGSAYPESMQRLAQLLVLGVLTALALAQPASVAQRPDDPFVPSRHGFAFVNHFTGSSLPPELRDADHGLLLWARTMAETYADLPTEFGLCGGMSLSAADYYLSQTPIPDSTGSPEQGTALYERIYQRQRDSLGLGSSYVLKFAHWMALPDIVPPADPEQAGPASGQVGRTSAPSDAAQGDHAAVPVPEPESTSSLTRAELPAICRALERGELVPLGLVLTRAGRGQLWNNHQVLAYALERRDDATLHIRIYDPNYPGDDGCIIRVEGLGIGRCGLEPGQDDEAIAALGPGNPATSGDMVRAIRVPTRGNARAIRGLFPMPYQPVVPGEDAAAAAGSPST